MLIRSLAALAGLLALSACGPSGGGAASTDPYAGLDAQMLAWRTEIENTHPACAAKNDGKGCEAFEVTCKGAQELTAEDAAQGVTAKVVAAMRFAAATPDGSSGKNASAFATFSKAGDQWTRTESAPVNPTTCAPF